MSMLQPIHFELLPPVPAISLVRRLKESPLFRFASMDELFRIAGIARQVRYAEGSRVQERGVPAEYIQVLVQGRFRVEAGAENGEVLAPPAMLGFQEVLKGAPLHASATAETESIALVIPAEEVRTLLAANIELAQGLFRMLLESEEADDSGHPVKTVRAARAASFRYEPRATPLSTVEKVMYLQTVPILSNATAEELYEVAAIAREVAFAKDDGFLAPGTPASIVLLLSGGLELASPGGGKSQVGAGTAIGVRETLAGARFAENGRVVEPVKALQIDREPLFDLLADRMDLLQGVFSAVFQRQNRTMEP